MKFPVALRIQGVKHGSGTSDTEEKNNRKEFCKEFMHEYFNSLLLLLMNGIGSKESNSIWSV